MERCIQYSKGNEGIKVQIDVLSHEQKTAIANVLNNIYYEVVIEETYSDNSRLLGNIIAIVDESNNIKRDYLKGNPEVSFRLSASDILVKLFGEKYNKLLDKVCSFAFHINTRLGYSTDLASVVCPYILYEFGVTNEEVSFYLGLGMVLANIICDSLSQIKTEQMEKTDETCEKEVYKTLIILLEEARKNTKSKQSKKQICESLDQISKIIKELE